MSSHTRAKVSYSQTTRQMLNEKHESGTARRIESGIARRGSSMSQAWPDEAMQAYSSQAWPDRYFKTSSQKVQQYGRVRHSPTDALKQIHKNCNSHKFLTAIILSAESCCSSPNMSMRARIQARFPMAERASSALPIGTARYSCAPSIQHVLIREIHLRHPWQRP